MQLQPLFTNETNTIKVSVAKPREIKLIKEEKVTTDPKGVISSGIYKVINWEKNRLRFVFAILSILTIANAIFVSVYSTQFAGSTKWQAYILPVVVQLLVIYKSLISVFELTSLNKSIDRYREDLRFDLASLPAFINKMYFNLYSRQVTHNWFTFFIVFYGSIFTLVFWWLKDVDWWILTFDKWIESTFGNPDLMVWVFSISLIGLLFFHITFVIHRKRRILEMDAYFGGQLAPVTEISKMQKEKNKFFRRLFIFSVLVILVIPILIKLILRYIKKTK